MSFGTIAGSIFGRGKKSANDMTPEQVAASRKQTYNTISNVARDNPGTMAGLVMSAAKGVMDTNAKNDPSLLTGGASSGTSSGSQNTIRSNGANNMFPDVGGTSKIGTGLGGNTLSKDMSQMNATDGSSTDIGLEDEKRKLKTIRKY